MHYGMQDQEVTSVLNTFKHIYKLKESAAKKSLAGTRTGEEGRFFILLCLLS